MSADESPEVTWETCYFYDVHAKVCHYEMLFLGCEPCADCPPDD